MANLKSLAKDTAIYGLSSIVGRFLNYLLVPVYTIALPASSGGYGVVTNVYAWVALMMVILTCGMETGFFRFANNGKDAPMRVYSTTLLTIGGFSLVFLVLGLTFLHPIAGWLGYADHPWYLGMMMLVVAMDAFQAIPFSFLRYQKKALRFASLKLLFIFLNIILNLIYYVGMGGHDVGKAFLINLICTSFIMLCMIPELRGFKYVFDKDLNRRMMRYCLPLLILGIAGILNQVADKIIFPYVYPDEAQGIVELGIYGACVKIAMIMAMITQAFRYAYEPFVFAGGSGKESKESQALVMKYFVMFTLLAFLTVMAYMDILRYIIKSDYWEGLRAVPIVMMAEIFMGIYFNLSFWYKLIGKTWWGAVMSAIGCVALLAVNIIFVPRCGYMACAWGGFVGYGVCMVLSYFIGQHHNPVPYPVKSIVGYFAIAMLLFAAMQLLPIKSTAWRLLANTLLLAAYAAFALYNERALTRRVAERIKVRLRRR